MSPYFKRIRIKLGFSRHSLGKAQGGGILMIEWSGAAGEQCAVEEI